MSSLTNNSSSPTDLSSRSKRSRGDSFQTVADSFLNNGLLPFANALEEARIEAAFRKHNSVFGISRVYSTAVVLWAFLHQVLCDGKQSACTSAVANITAYRLKLGLSAPSEDTGVYCKARAKLCWKALRELVVCVAEQTLKAANNTCPGDEPWLWKGRHAKLIDGFTFTMLDTPENQAEYPQVKKQKPGCGQPIARCAVVMSLATACVHGLAWGRYEGKQTSELALLRQLFDAFRAGEIAVMDRFYCSYFMMAALINGGVDVCTRQHQSRKTDFRRGRRLGKNDHVVTWTRPVKRPKWMDEATYAAMPKELELRELRVHVGKPGYRTQELTIVTTLTDAQEYTRADVVELYGFRWHVELDIRSIKRSLNLDHVRCKTPHMVRITMWTTLLAYNLIRSTAASAAWLFSCVPREISFTATCQYILSRWMLSACDGVASEADLMKFLEHIANSRVGNRPGRIEPRVIKRRRDSYRYMQQPRHELRLQLIAT